MPLHYSFIYHYNLTTESLNPPLHSTHMPIVHPSIPPVYHVHLSVNLSSSWGTGVLRNQRQKHSCIFNQHLLNIKHWTQTQTHTHTHLLSRQVIQVDGLTCVCMSAWVCDGLKRHYLISWHVGAHTLVSACAHTHTHTHTHTEEEQG